MSKLPQGPLNWVISIAGFISSFGAYFLWRAEVYTWLGVQAADELALRCLLQFGTGDCGVLWYAGLHQTNQTASAFFYGGIIAILIGGFVHFTTPTPPPANLR